jgi:putative intracellular protease/amidase
MSNPKLHQKLIFVSVVVRHLFQGEELGRLHDQGWLLITGQNPASSEPTAKVLIEALKAK